MSNISLSRSVRNNLQSLQSTSDLIATTQNRLATGKKVNSALDNPTNFFTSASLNSRANDLSGLLDGISNAVKTIEAADNGIKAITKLIESARASANSALQDNTTSGLPKLQGTNAALSSTTNLTDLGFANGDTITITFDNDTGTGGTTNTFTATVSGTAAIGSQQVKTVGDLISSVAVDAAGSNVELSLVDGKLNIAAKSGSVASGKVGSLALTGSSGAADLTNLGFGASNVSTTGSTNTVRSTLATQFNTIRDQINKLAQDAGFNGKNLLNGDSVSVVFNEKTGSNQSKIDVTGVTYSADGLGIKSATGSGLGEYNNFQSNADVNQALTDLTTSLSTLRTQASTFGSNLQIVQARQDFTNSTINTLKSGADNLVLANNNEEAANLLSLQTRQQLSQTALSLASQQDQAVLRLFG
jgi:flagellin